MLEKLVINSISCAVVGLSTLTPFTGAGVSQPKPKAMYLTLTDLNQLGPSCQVSQARSSVGERFLDTEEVGSSILPVPTIF